jgi:hypothetical protein
MRQHTWAKLMFGLWLLALLLAIVVVIYGISYTR